MRTEGLWLTDAINFNKGFEDDTAHWDSWASGSSTVSRDCTTAGEGSCSFKAYVAAAGNDWDTAVQQNLRIDPNVTYRLTFKAKASASTTIVATVGQDYDPYWDLGVYKFVDVGPTWQTYTYTFRSSAPSVDELAKIYFGFGSHAGTFNIDDVRLIPDDLTTLSNPSFEYWGDINNWNFWSEIGTYAMPCDGDATDGECAVQMTTATPTEEYWNTEFSHADLTVTEDTHYIFSFDAKAESPRDIHVEFGQAHDPWEQLGSAITLPLTTEWTHYVLDFTSNADDENARIGFYTANDDATVSLDNIRWREATNTKITDLTPDFSAIYDDLDTPDYAGDYQLQVDNIWGDFSDPLWDSGKSGFATSTQEGTRTPTITYDGPEIYPLATNTNGASNSGTTVTIRRLDQRRRLLLCDE
jgi:hypothetical protein